MGPASWRRGWRGRSRRWRMCGAARACRWRRRGGGAGGGGGRPWGVGEGGRRAGVPVAALERLAEADAFASLGLDRRQALWRVRGLGEAPLPLFAAAEARDPAPGGGAAAGAAGRGGGGG